MNLTGGTHGALTVRIWRLLDEYFETHDLAVEGVSPSDRLADVHVKIPGYFRAGSRLVWLFGSRTRIVLVTPSMSRWWERRMISKTAVCLPGFRCAVRRLFASVPSEQ